MLPRTGSLAPAAPLPATVTGRASPLDLALRAWGGVLLVLVGFPVYRLLAAPETGLAGAVTVGVSSANAELMWTGTLLAVVPALLLARLVPLGGVAPALARAGETLARLPALPFAAALAILAGALALAFSRLALGGSPVLVDAMSQLAHARYLAAGKLAGPSSPFTEFWHLQNTVLTGSGWVSQYPPGHVALLALGLRLGVVGLVGPAMLGLTVLLTALSADRLLRDRRVARLGALLLALSPFAVFLAGSFMNHGTAAACAAVALYAALRARDGRPAWALAAGGAAAAMFATRPLSALAIGSVATVGVWLAARRDGTLSSGGAARRVLLAALGALPLLAVLAAYNQHFFDSPFRFGYQAALGPGTGLGFHVDPWGNRYGPAEALGYTAADLLALGQNLLETPIPAILVIGLFLVRARRLESGEALVAVWAAAPVLANALYWHHGLFLGPRMLAEAAPAWALLAAVAAAGLVRGVPDRLPGRSGGRYSPRGALALALVAALVVGVGWLAPQRASSYALPDATRARLAVPAVEAPALVFVHGTWTGRLAARLAGGGMRLDSVETALRQNPTCAVQRFADARAAGAVGAASPALDFVPRASPLPPEIRLPSGAAVRAGTGERYGAACAAELHADRVEPVDLAPLLWRGDLPGIPGGGALLVRDLGPGRNAALIAEFPDRRPLLYYAPAPGQAPRLVDYEAGIRHLWEGAPAHATPAGGSAS